MKIETKKHIGVKPDGTFKNKLGAVETKGKIIMSNGEGCGLSGCKCSEGHWLTIVQPRTSKGVVKVVKVVFDDSKEMNGFLKNHELICE